MARWISRVSILLGLSLVPSARAQTATSSPPEAGVSGILFAPVSVGRPATPEELNRLNEAFLRVARDNGRWAYTETTVIKDDKGRIKDAKVVRFDPSKPYAEQYTPLEIKGQPPTEKQLKEYRLRGEKRGQRLERADVPGDKPKGRSLSEVVDLSRATIVRDDDQVLDYELPLRPMDKSPFPPDKFQVIARFDKARGIVSTVAVRLREAVRAKLILKIKSGEFTIDFTTIDPQFAPALTAVHGGASVSILFINVGGNLVMTHTDVKRVKPYGDRFEVQVGPAKALDFD